MNDVWKALVEDFSDLPDAGQVTRVVVRLVLAAVLGGVLGYERERKGKGAGMRTYMLISAGSALFAMVPQLAHMSDDAVSRVLQGLAAGVGFLGAGPILKREQQGEVHGLTTAAGIWMAAAIGMAAGLGREVTAILGAGLAFVILALLPHIDHPADPKPEQVRV
ncbi:MAG TPA: MgtC/SapB family protein [Gemmataceae bacterium]|nr:MgtC/SapB family protein [Gemmataceae bacterium]